MSAPFAPALDVCPHADDARKHNEWLDDPAGMGPFYAKYSPWTIGRRLDVIEHVITTSEPITPSGGDRWKRGYLHPYRRQQCSCGASWCCDAPEVRAMFLLGGWDEVQKERTGQKP